VVLLKPGVWLVVLALVVVAVGGLTLDRLHARNAEAEAAARAQPLDTPYAAIASGKADVEGGVIQIAARTAGVVSQVYVQEGDQVRKGEVLARLQDDQARLAAQTAADGLAQAKAQVEALEVQLHAADREYARLERLAPANFVAARDLDKARDAVASAQAALGSQQAAIATASAQLNQARDNVELTVIRAPVDGKIVRRYANPGAGASTLNVSDMFDLEPDAPHIVRAEIAEGSLPAVRVGQEAELTAEDDPSKVYVGKVLRRSEIFGARKLLSDDPSAKTDERVVEAVVSSGSAPFLIGQRVLVKFMKPGEPASRG
jgi:HlyD family secretion protein